MEYALFFFLGILVGLLAKLPPRPKRTWYMNYYNKRHKRWELWGEADKFRYLIPDLWGHTIHGTRTKIGRYKGEE